jgi:sulfite reductase (NADPH) hemoprotein beta-component
MANQNNLSEVEKIKEKSNYLRGTIKEGLIDEITGAIAPDDTQLIKFHGSYQQTDRDLDSERKKQKLEPLYSFMIRIRLPGGIATPEQWTVVDALADKYANNTIKLTTRQAFQLHGVFKKSLKPTIRQINAGLMDTIAACGDVNRNVMSNVLADQTEVHQQVDEDAREVSAHLTPQTTAYHEIWLEKQLVAGGKQDNEPIYGKTYLPRKFKIAFAIPPNNDTDVLANDLGFVAIVENKKLVGYNVTVGGGMGNTLENPETYPRLADVIGFIPREKAVEVAEKVVIVQRDNGNRSDRKVSRLKYTIDRNGLDWFKDELNHHLGWQLEPAKPFEFTTTGDQYGWKKSDDGKWSLTLFIEGGRVKDTRKVKLKTALKKIADLNEGDFRLTGNQNLVLGNISETGKKKITNIFKDHQVQVNGYSGLRMNSLACVALNTCSLAHADAERYLPSLIDKLDVALEKFGLNKEEITIRMTGCPNGCARPYLAEIGFVGRAVGKYNLYLGGGFTGNRINKLYKEMVDEAQILESLTPIFEDYSKNRSNGEKFGDFVIRQKYI